MSDSFAILGISPTSDLRLVRAAFRRKAALLHPDRHGNSRAASESFKGVVEAYEEAMRLARGGLPRAESAKRAPVTTPAPPAPIRERYACPRCDDTFPVDDCCPRCDEAVVDSWRGARVELDEDPRIDALIARLENGPSREMPSMPIPPAAAPFVAAALFVVAAWPAATIGLPVLGAMLGTFGLGIAALEGHDRVRRSLDARLYIF